jgi:hypothetical protein
MDLGGEIVMLLYSLNVYTDFAQAQNVNSCFMPTASENTTEEK